MPLRVRVFSDLHYNRRNFDLPPITADLVVLAGDIHCGAKGVIEAKKRFSACPVIYVPGNHEYYYHDFLRVVDEMRREAHGSNVHILERESIEFDGVTFFGCTLWSDFKLTGRLAEAKRSWRTESSQIWYNREDQAFTPELAIEIHRLSLQALRQARAGSPGRFVVVTHHAPSQRSLTAAQLQKPSAGAYGSDCEALIAELKPEVWIHGHTHYCVSYRLDQTLVLSNPLGYEKEKNTAFDPTLVLEL